MMFFTDLRLINNFDPSSRNDRMTIRTGIPIDNPIRRLLDISVVLTIPVVDSTLWSWSCVFSVVLIECGLSVELVVFGGRIDKLSELCAFTTSEQLSEVVFFIRSASSGLTWDVVKFLFSILTVSC